MVKSGSSVRLKKTYTGYFKNMRNMTLTVMQRIKRDPHYGCDFVTVMEIKGLHFLKVTDLMEIKHDKPVQEKTDAATN